MIRGILRKWLADRLGVEESKIGDDWEALQRLNVDSLDLVELVMEIEEEFDEL